jgi:cold shock CspA family protein
MQQSLSGSHPETAVVVSYGCRGFGWLDWCGRSVYCHISDVSGRAVLHTGEQVEFDLTESPKGPRARNVRVIETIEATSGHVQ